MHRAVHIRVAPMLFVLPAAVCGCSSGNTISNPDYCNVKIVDITPPAPTVHLGDTVVLHAAYTGTACSPNVPAASLRWDSSAPSVASVDSTTGIVTAHAAGHASVGVHVPGRASDLGAIDVTVVIP